MNFKRNSIFPSEELSFLKILKRFQTEEPQRPPGGNNTIPQDPYSPRTTPPPQKSFAFGIKALKSYYELAPVVVSVTLALILGGITAFRALHKNDVILDRTRELPPWERVDLERKELNKNLVVGQRFQGFPELKKLKKEINETDTSGAKSGNDKPNDKPMDKPSKAKKE